MSDLAGTLQALLPVYGPSLLFVLAVLETCFVTGLVVPSGLATSVATALALEGDLALAPVLGAALAGGWVGDSVGFWIGHAWGEHLLEGRGRIARTLARRQPEMQRFFGRHPFYSVSVARLVSFVRTVMPMTAGMSGISYRRYLPYEAVGLVGWLAIYVAIGAAGGEGWRALADAVGVGGAAAFALAGLAFWMVFQRNRRRTDRPAPPPAAPVARAPEHADASAPPPASDADPCRALDPEEGPC